VHVCLYSSAHGFGHTTRLLAVVDALLALAPDTRIVLNTRAPEWLVRVHMSAEQLTLRERALDVGLVQSDSFTTDYAATLAALTDLTHRAPALVAEEAAYLQAEGFDLVLADIPPLAGALAEAGDLPVWAMSNFGWDFIYADLGEELAAFVPWVRALYGQFSGLFRLPFCEPMSAFAVVEPVGLVVNRPRYDRPEMRAALGVDSNRPAALLTFGGLGMSGFPTARVAEHPDWLFLVTDPKAPDLPNVLKVASGRWRLIELLTAVDLAIIKPGYSTVAECCALGLPTVSLTRPGFAEAELLLSGVRAHLPHRILEAGALFDQPWDFLAELGTRGTPLPADGAQTIARRLLAIGR